MTDGDSEELRAARHRMVDEQIADRGVVDDRVIEAMRTVPRHAFVRDLADAYADRPSSIGHGATISQPYIVALMSEALQLRPTDRVLEVGTGSGYSAAILDRLAAHVTTIETIEPLAAAAAERLADIAPNVRVVVGDGSLGHPDDAPYDAICVTAGAPHVPEPLLEQLADGGRLVAPIGRGDETLVRITRHGDSFEREDLLAVRFIPLRGEHGW